MAVEPTGGIGGGVRRPPTPDPWAARWQEGTLLPPWMNTTRMSQYWPSADALIAEQMDARLGRAGGYSAESRLGQAAYPTAPSWPSPDVTINVGQPTTGIGQAAGQAAWQPTGQPQPPASWGQPQPAPAPVPGMPPMSPSWWESLSPFFEGGGAPTDFMKLRPQDWAAMPKEVRSELEEWLRRLGWRPGGRWGRHGALEWSRAQGASPWTQPGQQYLGENVFAGLSERVKPWLWFLAQSKGWAQGPATRPATQGWAW